MFRRTALSVAALAAAALLLESALTRLLAVAQYYHFAFLVVSLALLGFGASGTFLSLRKTQTPNPHIYRLAGAGFAASTLLAYAVVNWLPFDSYTIAWEHRQLLYFAFYYLVLALPFFCSGVGIGAGLAVGGGRGHLVYAANLFGSALGVLLALVALTLAGVPGDVLASIAIALLPAGLIVIAAAGFGALTLLNAQARVSLGLVISPYKGLAYALRYPGAATVFGKWNAISRAGLTTDTRTEGAKFAWVLVVTISVVGTVVTTIQTRRVSASAPSGFVTGSSRAMSGEATTPRAT